MAKANDRDYNLIHVLVDCFVQWIESGRATHATRNEIHRLRKFAYELIERERLTKSSKDVVDVVMQLANQARITRGPTHFYPFVKNPTGAHLGIRSK